MALDPLDGCFDQLGRRDLPAPHELGQPQAVVARKLGDRHGVSPKGWIR
jgi:hypothetical protein